MQAIKLVEAMRARQRGYVPPGTLQKVSRAFDPAGFFYDFARPKLKNPDGSFSTEETATVGFGNRQYNIPTIVNGQRVPIGAAVSDARGRMAQGTVFPNFATEDEAVKQAKLRSQWRGLLEQYTGGK
jgi:hypothetical protein